MKSILSGLRSIGGGLAEVLAPDYCMLCGGRLSKAEHRICALCRIKLPATDFHRIPGNAMQQRFAGYGTIENAGAVFYYVRSTPLATAIHDFKYNKFPSFGRGVRTGNGAAASYHRLFLRDRPAYACAYTFHQKDASRLQPVGTHLPGTHRNERHPYGRQPLCTPSTQDADRTHARRTQGKHTRGVLSAPAVRTPRQACPDCG